MIFNMNPHILIAFAFTTWIGLATSHSIPIMQMVNNVPHLQPIQLHHLNQLYNVPVRQSPPIMSRRQARGFLSTLAGISSVAANANLLSSNDDDDSPSGGSSSSSSSSNSNKPKPYAFTDVEMTAIQTMISLRNILGDLLHKMGVNIPSSLASLITRSENLPEKNMLSSGADSAASSLLSSAGSKVNAALLLRGLALSLPLLIPMANQLRRMSSDSGVIDVVSPSSAGPLSSAAQSSIVPLLPQLPQFDPYGYDRALHRRRGKRSVGGSGSDQQELPAALLSAPINRMLRQEEMQRILRYLKDMETIYGFDGTQPQQQQQQQQQRSHLQTFQPSSSSIRST